MKPCRLLCLLLPLFPLAAADPEMRWCWSGGVTDDAATVVAAVDGAQTGLLRVLRGDGEAVVSTAEAQTSEHGVMRFAVHDLEADTTYRYHVMAGAEEVLGTGRLHTLPTPLEPADFTVAMGSCNDQPNSIVFDAIRHQDPLLFLHTGDLHYSDIDENDPQRFRAAYERQLTAERQGALYRSTPIAYMWDDHDYGPNDSRHDSPARPAAHATYRALVPHYPFAWSDDDAPIAQAVTIGRVRFILTDLRSDHQRQPGSILGQRQREWFFQELADAADTHALVVWVSTVPWNGKRGSKDRWEGNRDERQAIADRVKAHDVPLCIIAGDAHMSAIDDGSNSDFATDGGAPIPVFQAGALDRKGSYKAGPYSHGARPGGKQFGLMRIEDDGERLTVTWEARDGSDGTGDRVLTAKRDGDGPISYSFTIDR